MKKIKGLLLVFTMLCLSFTSQAQGKNYQPYLNAGASLSSGVTSLGGEVGFYNNKAWYAVGISTGSSQKTSWYLSPKGYWKLTGSKESDVDGYFWSAVNVALDRTHALSVEPGVAAVFNITKKFAPQLSLSFPVGENSVLRGRPLQVNFGLSINYWVR